MIDVEAALGRIPHFDTFLTLAQLHAQADRLAADPRFDVRVAGTSGEGRPIHHVTFGSGAVKALFVAGPQAQEPTGGLTASSLLHLLQHDDPSLRDADVEWHVVPCIDPDAALLNEDWYVEPFTFDHYMRNYYMQPRIDQVDFTFPVNYKDFVFDKPSTEAKVLLEILERVGPDFY